MFRFGLFRNNATIGGRKLRRLGLSEICQFSVSSQSFEESLNGVGRRSRCCGGSCWIEEINDELKWVATTTTATLADLADRWGRRSRCRCGRRHRDLNTCISVSICRGHHFPSSLLLCCLVPPPFLILRSSTISCSELSSIHHCSSSLCLCLCRGDKGFLFRQIGSKEGHGQDGHSQTDAKAWKERKSAAHCDTGVAKHKNSQCAPFILQSLRQHQRQRWGNDWATIIWLCFSYLFSFQRLTSYTCHTSSCYQTQCSKNVNQCKKSVELGNEPRAACCSNWRPFPAFDRDWTQTCFLTLECTLDTFWCLENIRTCTKPWSCWSMRKHSENSKCEKQRSKVRRAWDVRQP